MADTYDDGQGSSFPGPDDFISMRVVRKSGTTADSAGIVAKNQPGKAAGRAPMPSPASIVSRKDVQGNGF